MFFKMIRGTLLHQWKKMLMIALTIALGSSLATAMISVVMDVGDKVNQELKAYGANITVVPKQSSIVSKWSLHRRCSTRPHTGQPSKTKGPWRLFLQARCPAWSGR